MFESLVDALVNMKEKDVLEITTKLMSKGEDPLKILNVCTLAILNVCTLAMEKVGQRFEAGEYFLPELMMAGEMLRQISEIVKPGITGIQSVKKKGKVLMGTVQGDIHNIGKDIVTFLLDVNGFEVRDIGIDIPPSVFVENIKEFQPQVVGLSGLLTLAYDAMKDTVEAIEKANLRNRVKIMIGGGQMSVRVCEYAGADAYGKDAMEGVALVKKWIGEM
jgi:5-methyltetrahydrofolate--homocysteine methyltransferase